MKKSMKNSVNSRPTEMKSINNPNEINGEVKIPVYYSNMGLMPKEYQISPQLYGLETRFKELCVDFLADSNSDENNSSYMDAIIDRMCVDAIKFIKVQRCDHEQLIMNLLNNMHNGDYCDAKIKLQYFLNDREENERELAKYRRIKWTGTALAEEGKLCQ